MGPTAATLKPDRNGFSHFLQRASSKMARDADGAAGPKPTAKETRARLSPSRPLMNVSARSQPPPHLPHSEELAPVTPPLSAVPPTTNQPDSLEKAKSTKKARKISRVFGEVPVLELSPSEGDQNGFAGFCETEYVLTKPSRSPFGFSNGRRCVQPNVSKEGFLLDDTQAAPPTSSILPHGRASIDPRPSLCSPNESFTSGACTSLDSSPTQSPGDADTPSISFSPITPPVHIRKARLTKLTRFLGENIPLQLIPRPSTADDSLRARSVTFEGGNHRRSSSELPSLESSLLSSDEMSASLLSAGNENVKRSRSLNLRESDADAESMMNIQKTSDLKLNSVERTTERGRFMNVKRARKMTQLFGHDPPPELFQITYDILERPQSPRNSSRESIATVTATDSISSHMNLPPIDLDLDLDASTDALPILPEIHPSSFQTRRRRAAKLSRFFGVGLQDLSPSLSPPEVHIAKPPSPIDQLFMKQDSITEVDIEVNNRGRFWGLVDGRSHLKEVDMVDVRDKLRRLRAA